MTVVAIAVVATLVMVVTSAVGICLMFMIRSQYQKQRLSLTLYDVPYNYALPPLPPRVQRKDLGLYDTISNDDINNMESETAFSTAAVNSVFHNRISFNEQYNIENDVVPSVFDTETCQKENEMNTSVLSQKLMNDIVMQSIPATSDASRMQERWVGESRTLRTETGDTGVNREVHVDEMEESTASSVRVTIQENQVTVGESRTEMNDTQINNVVEESTPCTGVRMQENVSYQPSTNFIFATNPAYETDIAIAPEIPTEENVAYQHMRGDQPRVRWSTPFDF